MHYEQKDCILANHEYFTSNMADVEKVCDCLLSSGVLTHDMYDKILAEKTRVDKARSLNRLVPMRGDEAFDKYYDALNASGHKQLATRLKRCLSLNLHGIQNAQAGQDVGDGDGVMDDQAKGGRATNDVSETEVPTHQKQDITMSNQMDSQPILKWVRKSLSKRSKKFSMPDKTMTGSVNDEMPGAVENSSVVLVAASENYTESYNCKLATKDTNKTEESIHQKQNIMISYEAESRPILERVQRALKERGYTVLMEDKTMTGNVNDAMAGAVENSSVVLVAASEKYTESCNCKLEAEYAEDHNKPIIPLLMESNFVTTKDDWFDHIARSRTFIKFTNKTDVDNSISELVAEIEKKLKESDA